MTDIKEQVEDENKIDTVISDDIELKGKLVFKNSLKIKGSFEGKIESDGHLILGQEAEISADIISKKVSVFGSVKGKIKAGQRIELFHNSKTYGDLVTPDLAIEGGSLFNGTCVMSEEK